MIRLLRANLSRAIKSKVLWIWTILYSLYAIFLPIIIQGNGVTPEISQGVSDLLFSMNYGLLGFPLQGMGIAIITSVILGAEFFNGTIRNKVILGQTRINIYASALLTMMIISIATNVVYMLFFFCIAMPIFGGFALSASSMLWIFINGTLMMLVYASITTLIAMSSQNSTSAIILSFAILIIGMFLAQICDNIVKQDEFYTGLTRNEYGEIVEELIRNPHYPSDATRGFLQFIIDLFPSGQSMQISRGEYSHTWQMALYSLGLIGATTGSGILVFKKSNLK